jgi:hypothetical protein
MYVVITAPVKRTITVDIPRHIWDSIIRLCHHHEKITAVKLIKGHTGFGLRDSKMSVEAICDGRYYGPFEFSIDDHEVLFDQKIREHTAQAIRTLGKFSFSADAEEFVMAEFGVTDKVAAKIVNYITTW